MPLAPAVVEKAFRYKLKYYFLLGLFFSEVATAQSNTTHQSLYWIRYYNQTQLISKYTLHVELDERRLVNPDLQFQFFSHIHLHRKISKSWDAAMGFTYARTNSNNNNSLVVSEYRPFQEVSFTVPLFLKIQGQIRYRLDERFIENHNLTELQDGYTFTLRHRFRFQLSKVVLRNESGKKLTTKLSEEIMLNSGSKAVHTFDQNRIYIAVEFQFNKKWSTEIGYLNLYQSATGDEFFARDILRCTVYHRLSFIKE